MMASSPHFIFSWPVLLLYYVSSHFPVIFRLCLFSFLSLLQFFFFPLLSLVLEILFGCLGWLPAPTVFLLLPNFFSVKGALKQGAGDSSSCSAFTARVRRWAKLFVFWTPHLWMEGVGYTASWVCFSTRCHVGSSHGAEGAGWGRKQGYSDDAGVGTCSHLVFLFQINNLNLCCSLPAQRDSYFLRK